MLLKTLFLLLHLFCNVEFKFRWFYNTKQLWEILIAKIEMQLKSLKSLKDVIEIIRF